MAEQYFVAESPESGLIGLLPELEVRHRLATGALKPTFVCLPASATGEVAGQWRPLGAVFATHPSDPPATDIVPAPRRRRPVPRWEIAVWLLSAGVVIAAVGVAVRVKARAWAWPDQWTYYGDRANTAWAYNEALYIDLGLASMALGIGLLLLGLWRLVTRGP